MKLRDDTTGSKLRAGISLVELAYEQVEQCYSCCYSVTEPIDLDLIPGDSAPCLTSLQPPVGVCVG